MILKEIPVLIQKEFKLEWRQKFALQGLILYLASTIFVCYLSFKTKTQSIHPITWNTLFWIIILFVAINAVGKSFTQESKNRDLFYYTAVSPEAIIYSKIIYNSIILCLVSFIGIFFYAWVMDNPIQNLPIYLLSLFLGAIGFASTLTLVAGIAAKGDNNATLMAVLSFPLTIPLLLILIKVSKSAMDGFGLIENWNEIAILFALDVILVTLSGILFPYLWRN